jgi:serine/threonine protein kinase, bacterial
VLMYNPAQPNPSPLGSIIDGINGPMGVAVDKQGQLYVVNIGNNTVTIYPHGSTSPSLTIDKGLWAPAGIGVDSKGNVFVANEEQFVTGYRPGRKTPFETISFRSIGGQAIGLAVDPADTVWVVCDNLDALFTIPHGKKTAQNANLSGLGGPMGVSFGKNGMMYVSNYSGGNVLVYAPGTTTPALTITDGITNPTFNGVSTTGRFFQANYPGTVAGYKAGSTQPFTTIETTPGPWGVAAYPPVNQ